MPFATNDGVHIHYEIEGSGPPLVLHVGYGGRRQDWQRQDVGVVQALRDDYQLILLDPRGFGDSDKPHEPAAYAADQVAYDVVAVLDAIGVERAHFWGYSRGAIVGFWLATLASDRFESLILGGAHPYPDDAGALTPEQIEALRTGEMDNFLALWEASMGPLPVERRAVWLANDPLALLAVELAMAAETGARIDASAIGLPALLYCGDQDGFHDRMQEVARSMPNAMFISLPGLNHSQSFRRDGTDLILPRARAFLSDLSG